MKDKWVQLVNKLQLIFKANESSTHDDTTRSNVIKKNVIFSGISKVLSVLVSFITIPLAIKYLGQYQFGVYATINSVVLWVDLFDLGLGQGLRNRLVEVNTVKNYKLAKEYISTTYFFVFLISLIIFIGFVIINFFVNWNIIFNVRDIDEKIIERTVFVVVVFFLLRFISNIITKVFLAMQYSAWVSYIQLFSKILLLIVLIILLKYSVSSVFLYACAQSSILFISPLIFSFFFYKKKFKQFSPSFTSIKIKHFQKLMGLGIKFFLIQGSLLIIFSSNNYLISYFVNPAQVTVYQVGYNLFNIFNVMSVLIMAPLWSAYTEAWGLNRILWIKKTLKTILTFFLIIVITATAVLLLSPLIYRLWIGKEFHILFSTSFLVFLFILINIWTRIFDYFLNGISKLKLQMYLIIIAASINLPLSYLFAVKLGYGLNGIILGSVLSSSLTGVSAPIQTYKLLNGKARGIWNR